MQLPLIYKCCEALTVLGGSVNAEPIGTWCLKGNSNVHQTLLRDCGAQPHRTRRGYKVLLCRFHGPLMFNSSLSRRLTGWTLPTSTKPPSISGNDNNTGIGDFAPELLDRITDHLHNDPQTLLRLGLASRQTLVRSRLHLFSELEFKKDGDRQFDMFLTFLEAPWTSLTNAVESLHFKELFYPRGYKYLPAKNVPRILANLPNLKTLRLTSISWPYIPPHIRDFFLQTKIADLQLDSVEFTTYRPGKIDLVELFFKLQPSIKLMTLYNLQFDDEPIPNISQYTSIFRRQIHLTLLDTSSLLLFKDVWDPLHTNDLDITVESFQVRLVPLTRSDREVYTPFFSRFLRVVGPSLHHIFIKLSDPYLDTCKQTFRYLAI